jgi:hypothetical protein
MIYIAWCFFVFITYGISGALIRLLTSRSTSQVVGFVGILWTFVFLATVSVPYFFFGYAEMLSNCQLARSGSLQCPIMKNGLSWTDNQLFGHFSYNLSGEVGQVVLKRRSQT